MITLLRKIRRRLLSENERSEVLLQQNQGDALTERTSLSARVGRINTYLLYAIGEILLVVVGILIALQINNWNENRKNRQIELKLLTGILENLDEDHTNLNNVTKRLGLTLQNIDRLFHPHPIPDDSLAYVATRAHGFSQFLPITAAYERGSNGGDFSLIRADSIAQAIQRLYSFEYESVKDAQEGLLRKSIQLQDLGTKYGALEIRPFKRNKGLYDTEYTLPLNLEKLKKRNKDPELKNIYGGIYENINALILFYQDLSIKNRATANRIKHYLNSKAF